MSVCVCVRVCVCVCVSISTRIYIYIYTHTTVNHIYLHVCDALAAAMIGTWDHDMGNSGGPHRVLSRSLTVGLLFSEGKRTEHSTNTASDKGPRQGPMGKPCR